MKKLIIGGLAALTFGLGVAPVAGADANDRAFIAATDRVISGRAPGPAQTAGSDTPRFPLSSESTPPTGCVACSMLALSVPINTSSTHSTIVVKTPDISPLGSSRFPSSITAPATATRSGSSDARPQSADEEEPDEEDASKCISEHSTTDEGNQMTRAIEPGGIPIRRDRDKGTGTARRGVLAPPSRRLTHRRFHRRRHFLRWRSRVGSSCSSPSCGQARGTSISA